MMHLGKLEILRAGMAPLDISELGVYHVDDYDGFGMPPMHRLAERGPLQHGETDLGFRLDARLIQIALTSRAANWDGLYERRARLLDYLSPTETISLRLTQPGGAVLQIDGFCIEGPIFSKKEAILHLYQRASFRLRCPDPAWYDPDQKSIFAFAGASGGSGFGFPMDVPWTFGGSTVALETVVPYEGSWLDYPTLVIRGPIADPVVTHVETGDKLDFDGLVMVDGDEYTIDLGYGRKTVIDQAGANQIGKLTPDSDLATWRLQPGQNTVRFEGTGAGSNTLIALRYYNRYIGV